MPTWTAGDSFVLDRQLSVDTIISSGNTTKLTKKLQLTASTPLSLATNTDANDLVIGDVMIVHQASGLSLVFSSGVSLYDLGSGLSEAQPTS